MPPATSLLREAGPGILGGATFGEWLAILRANGFAVDPRYLPRSVVITVMSLATSLAAVREPKTPPGPAIAQDPLFITGLWRSGTTHLHNLLTRDRRFACVTLYEALNPHTFLRGGRRGADRMDRLVPRHRLMDAMAQGAHEPVEEDIAMAVAGMSSMLGLVFPRQRDIWWRYVTMEHLRRDERERWRAAYRDFLHKVTVAKGRPLVLKSPANTARVALLLEMFPGARFINIHRHPCEVFASTVHTLNVTSRWWRLQAGDFDDEWILDAYAEVYDAWFRQRALIPPGRLAEVAFADLERDPVGEVARLYAELGLPAFDGARDDLRAYVDSIRGYARNRYREPSSDLRRRVRRAWERAFAEWGYRA